DYKTTATRQFVDRVFSGRAAPLVAHLADSRGLTDEDIAELEKLLGELKK
ncbi:MAG: BlaI/MecI/CopY family transcriptional regulator, partial [Pseudomonadota bacterium]